MLAGIDLAYAFGAHKAQGMTFGKSIAVMDSRTGKLLSACNTGDKTSALEVTYRLGTAAAKGQEAGKPPESQKHFELERTIERVKPFEMGI